MQNEIDKSGRVEASKIGVLQCIWKHVIGKGHSKKDTWDGGVHRNGGGRRGGE